MPEDIITLWLGMTPKFWTGLGGTRSYLSSFFFTTVPRRGDSWSFRLPACRIRQAGSRNDQYYVVLLHALPLTFMTWSTLRVSIVTVGRNAVQSHNVLFWALTGLLVPAVEPCPLEYYVWQTLKKESKWLSKFWFPGPCSGDIRRLQYIQLNCCEHYTGIWMRSELF